MNFGIQYFFFNQEGTSLSHIHSNVTLANYILCRIQLMMLRQQICMTNTELNCIEWTLTIGWNQSRNSSHPQTIRRRLRQLNTYFLFVVVSNCPIQCRCTCQTHARQISSLLFQKKYPIKLSTIWMWNLHLKQDWCVFL